MLKEHDIKWIKSNREEITRNRLRPITLIGHKKVGEHPVTGEPITEEMTEEAMATVVEITSAFKLDISLEGGVLTEKGDLWVVIDLDELEELGHNEFDTIDYDGEHHRVMAADREGIGEHNRVTIVARLVD